MVFNTFYVCFLVLYVFSMLCILCFVSFCVLFRLLYIAMSFLFFFLNKFTDRCHHVDTRLQKINIVSYQCICFQTTRTDIVN
jgi:hemerythrin-like domain-containing protein